MIFFSRKNSLRSVVYSKSVLQKFFTSRCPIVQQNMSKSRQVSEFVDSRKKNILSHNNGWFRETCRFSREKKLSPFYRQSSNLMAALIMNIFQPLSLFFTETGEKEVIFRLVGSTRWWDKWHKQARTICQIMQNHFPPLKNGLKKLVSLIVVLDA